MIIAFTRPVGLMGRAYENCFCLIAVAFFLLGCGGHEGEAKNAIKAMLKDPESAQFSGLVVTSKGSVCGVVNAKNSMGGFVGGQPFFYEMPSRNAVIAKPIKDSDFRSLWTALRLRSIDNELSDVIDGCKAIMRWTDVCETPYPSAKHRFCDKVTSVKDLHKALQDAFE